VVVAMATPGPHNQYRLLDKLPREQAAIRRALNAAESIEAVFVPAYQETENGELPGITFRGLEEALVGGAVVFHFSGHGEFKAGAVASEGAVVFAGDSNQAAPIPADRLGILLRGKGVQLAVLGACQTGRRDGRNVWNGVAAQLLLAGIPSVVAMQFTIQEELAAAFCASFYLTLSAGLTVDEAVAAGSKPLSEGKCRIKGIRR
jgi:CHAT domain-containing protein